MSLPSKTISISPRRLSAISQRLLVAAGSSATEAELIADNLVASNVCGHDSHGVGYLAEYLRTARAGSLVPNQRLEVVADSGAVIVCDGGRGYGQVMGKAAMELGIARVAETGICAVSLRNSHHLGRIGAWAEMCADAGFASVHFTNVHGHAPLVAPFGGGDARLGTNPLTCSFPSPDPSSRPHVVLDMASSMIALGKCRNAFQAGLPLAPNLVLDALGNASTDPGVMFPGSKPGETAGATKSTEDAEQRGGQPNQTAATMMGALVAAAQHKGYGLGLMSELYAAVATGGDTVAPHNRGGSSQAPAVLNSMFTVIFDPVATSGAARGSGASERKKALAALHDEVTLLTDFVKSSPPRPGHDAEQFGGVMVPGERANRNRESRREAVSIDSGTWMGLRTAAAGLGLDAAALFEGGDS